MHAATLEESTVFGSVLSQIPTAMLGRLHRDFSGNVWGGGLECLMNEGLLPESMQRRLYVSNVGGRRQGRGHSIGRSSLAESAQGSRGREE
jgi:hypothetical protein